MRILYDNKALTATISALSQNPDYPATNIQDTRLSRFFRSLIGDEVWVKCSAASITASYCAVLNHNITSGYTVRVQANTTDEWVSPALSVDMTAYGDMFIANFTEASYPYWRVVFMVDSEASELDYIQIGFMFLGTFLQLPGMKPDQQVENETTSKVTLSYSGQAYGDIGYEHRNPTINLPNMTNAQRLGIIAMWETVRNVKPVILLMWANDLDFESPIYCVIDQKAPAFKRTSSYRLPWSTSIKFREVF